MVSVTDSYGRILDFLDRHNNMDTLRNVLVCTNEGRSVSL
jgi:hypothetical protein